jgi:hypothetical protein
MVVLLGSRKFDRGGIAWPIQIFRIDDFHVVRRLRIAPEGIEDFAVLRVANGCEIGGNAGIGG